MDTGTIVLTRFPFTDLSSTKRRPAVVISRVFSDAPDVVVAFISSVLPESVSDADFILRPSHKDFKMTGLKKGSVFKMDKLATLDRDIFSGEIGHVSSEILTQLRIRLRKVFSI